MSGEYNSGGGAMKREITLRAVDVLNMLGRELGWRRGRWQREQGVMGQGRGEAWRDGWKEGGVWGVSTGPGADADAYPGPAAPASTSAFSHPIAHFAARIFIRIRTHNLSAHPQQQQKQQQHPWRTLPEMHSYNFVPQPPLSHFCSTPHNNSLINSFRQQSAEMGHSLMWVDLQNGMGAGEHWGADARTGMYVKLGRGGEEGCTYVIFRGIGFRSYNLFISSGLLYIPVGCGFQYL